MFQPRQTAHEYPIGIDAREARELAARLMEVMTLLLDVLRRETDLVRAGDVREAMKLAENKERAVRALCQRDRISEGKPELSGSDGTRARRPRCIASTIFFAACCK